jgi:integrase
MKRGYTELSAAEQLRLMGHLSRWMAEQGLVAVLLSPEQMAAYCRDRRAQGYTARLGPGGLRVVLEFLQSRGVEAPPSVGLPASAEQRLLDHYENYLEVERGLVTAVVVMFVKAAAVFLAAHPGLAEGVTVIATAEVTAFCSRELPGRSVSVAQNLAAALRSFLRFLHLEGVVAAPLAQAVPPVANRGSKRLPRPVTPATVARLLASCDRRTRRGRRDYAILLVLARLGLRAGEVAGLLLDNVDWRAGEIVVRGKGGRVDRLPLPDDVGAAIVAYLRRGRPRSDSRAVFLRAIAPAVGLNPTAITWVVTSACDRAGMAHVSAHRFRHGLACEMLRGGASLTEIGQVLRHGAVGTSAIYANPRKFHQTRDYLVTSVSE